MMNRLLGSIGAVCVGGAVALGVCGLAAAQPAGAETKGGSAGGSTQAAAGAARFRARLAPGQAAVYEMVETDTSKPGEEKRSRVRVEVLRITEDGIVVRGTDRWKGTDLSVRPQPRGMEADRTDEVTFDVLIPHDGSGLVAADREAALDEMVGNSRMGPAAKGADEAKLKRAEANLRAMMREPATVDRAVFKQFAGVFDGLGAAFTSGESAPVVTERGTLGVSMKITSTVTTAVEGDGNAVRRLTEVIPAEEHRRLLRELLDREAKAQNLDMKAAEPIFAERLAQERDTKDVMEQRLELASGWPVKVVMSGEKTSKGVTFTAAKTFTLVQGPEPVVPAPGKGAADESGVGHVDWLAGMLGAEKKPVRLYGRMGLDAMEHPTAEQRALLFEKAAGAGGGAKGEEPPAVTLAGAASAGLKAEDAEKVAAAYGRLSPEARRAVLVNVIGQKEAWGGDLFARLLKGAATEKELDEIPFRVIGKDAALTNRALKAALAETKAGAFDWAIVYAAYELEGKGELGADVRDASMARAAAVLGAKAAEAEPLQKAAHGAWVYADEYQPVSELIGLAADLLGSAKGEVGVAELRRAAKLTDERAAAFAIGALVRRGEKVEGADIGRICAGPAGWHALVPQLVKAGKIELVPEKLRTLEAAARANMVNWLVYPTELGREPDELVLEKMVDIGEGATKERYAIFKFRSDAEGFKEKGWMMGLSGPWDPAKPFTQSPGGHTFSRFEPIGKGTAEEQAKEIIEQLREAWQKRVEEKK